MTASAGLQRVDGILRQTYHTFPFKHRGGLILDIGTNPSPQFCCIDRSEMEQSLSSLTFKGSIPDAIAEAKIQKKLFVVYISGGEADSICMENSTWRDLKISESISKYCILLHIAAGSADAANFSGIYPQKCVPCITAVGYNGVQIWQHEGFIDSESLASSLEKAWLSLHIQETTASIMAAALAGRASSYQASSVVPSEQGSPSSALIPSNDCDQSSEAMTSLIEDKGDVEESIKGETTTSAEPLRETTNPVLAETHDSVHDNQCFKMENEVSPSEAREKFLPEITEGSDSQYSNIENECPSSKAKGKHIQDATEGANLARGSSDLILLEKLGSLEEITKTDSTQTLPTSSKSSDVHLNIRLPDGVSLQDKFSVTSTLEMVKDYVDENRANDNGPYNLAIPYPRKVFNDQDLIKSLAELELFGRQTLILVPHGRGRSNNSRGAAPVSYPQRDSSAADGEGYFAFAMRVLSYFNPLSYLGGRSNGAPSSSEQEHNYRTNPNGGDSYVPQGRPYSQEPTSWDTMRNRRPTTSRFSSNIHTLKHDEDENRFKDRNSFWNGNSTEYGGDNSQSR
ncbi:hypothetical protein SAY87_010313 [Trapa incisa]|uniref:UBX domain-containing protein n=1 Tax=Trapa incisa TaxID=236973 RepID=A0AAN7GHK2_9MYRT|nr:hypothetical protein SAY87_010313 [Trapa incisa]